MKSDRSWSYKDRESLKIHSSDSLITFKPNLYSIQREKKNTQKFQMFEIKYKYEKILHTFTYLIWLVVEPTHLKKYQSKWVHLPWVGMNIKKSLSCQKPSYGLLPFRCFLKWWYPQNTPKWSFLVGKPEKLLGKPTILGNHHIFVSHPIWFCPSASLYAAVPLRCKKAGPVRERFKGSDFFSLRCGGKWESYCWWTKSCTTKDDDSPIIYRVLTIPGGAGFCPSTVSPKFHQKSNGTLPTDPEMEVAIELLDTQV